MPDPQGHVLVVDDNREVLTAMRLLLKDHVGQVHTAQDPAAIAALLREHRFDAILLDMNFRQGVSSGQEGFQWLERILQRDPSVSVIMITAYGDVEKAVHAMKLGAVDFIVKPWDNDKLVRAVESAMQLRRSRADAAAREPAEHDTGVASTGVAVHDAQDAGLPDEIIGESPAMERVFETIRKVAATEANVLILGEHGTGKELVARALHRHSHRAGGPFVSVDLGALSRDLFESELFGHVKGAFTGAEQDRAGRFEAAAGGTVFLDEIGNIPMPLQNKLLTVLERRAVSRVGSMETVPLDIRLICATNMPIYDMASPHAHLASERDEGFRFRQDLLFRINTVEILLPPLRERGDDVLLLARYYLQHFARKYDRPAATLSAGAAEALRDYHWPGNVRELRHTMERAVIMSEERELTTSDLRFSAPAQVPSSANTPAEDDTLDLEEVERTAIRRALSKHGGNITRAADELGLTRRSLYRRIEKYGL